MSPEENETSAPPATPSPTTCRSDDSRRLSPGEVRWATSRSRLGLILGPGSLLILIGLSELCRWLSPASDPDWATNFEGIFVVAVLHLASLIEGIATAPMLLRKSCPITVWLLAIYWATASPSFLDFLLRFFSVP